MNNLSLMDRAIFEQFVKPGEVTEIRAFVSGKHPAWRNAFSRGVVAGYFDSHEPFCQAVKALDPLDHDGIYFTLQVIDRRLLARSFNRLSVLRATTSDRDVMSYRWLPIDLDPVRPAGISSSDSELKAALTLRDQIALEIQTRYGFASEPVRAMSGNGAHLLYRFDLERSAARYAPAIKELLDQISSEYSTPEVKIDREVSNPARIWKLYGTTAKKGDAVPAGPNREARPHRKAWIESVPWEVAQ
jgi:hypothetical protein